MDSFTIELVSIASAQIILGNTLSFYYIILCRNNWIWNFNERLHFWKYPAIIVLRCYRGDVDVFFDKENFQCRQKFKIWKSVCTFLIQILLKPWTLSFKKDTITAKMVSQLKCLEERNNLRFILQRDDLVLLFSWTWGTSSKVMMAMSEEQRWREKDHTNQFMPTTLLAYTLSWYTKIWSTTILLGTRKFFVALLSIYF